MVLPSAVVSPPSVTSTGVFYEAFLMVASIFWNDSLSWSSLEAASLLFNGLLNVGSSTIDSVSSLALGSVSPCFVSSTLMALLSTNPSEGELQFFPHDIVTLPSSIPFFLRCLTLLLRTHARLAAHIYHTTYLKGCLPWVKLLYSSMTSWESFTDAMYTPLIKASFTCLGSSFGFPLGIVLTASPRWRLRCLSQ